LTFASPTAVIIEPFGPTGWSGASGTWDGTTLNITFTGEPNGDQSLTGTLGAMCASIQWSNGATWTRGDDTVETVTMVFMVHLDVGFTNLAANVCDLYFNDHFPTAFNTSRTLRARGGEERYVWTEFTWLVAGRMRKASARCVWGGGRGARAKTRAIPSQALFTRKLLQVRMGSVCAVAERICTCASVP
jgi:hypothetical protein